MGRSPTARARAKNGSIGSAIWSTQAKFWLRARLQRNRPPHVTVPDSSSLDLSTGMTLEALVLPSLQPLAVPCDLQGMDDIYYLVASCILGCGRWVGSRSASSRERQNLPENTWSHIAGTYDGSSIRMYVDGTQVASRARTAASRHQITPLTIGGDALYGQHFHGNIDEVRVYGRALTATQIQSDMNTRIGGELASSSRPRRWILSRRARRRTYA